LHPSTKSSPKKSQARKALSTESELFVSQCLTNQSWTILDRNYRRRGCEIDIIALKQGTLAFVEVKARRLPMVHLNGVEAFLSPRKLTAMRRGAEHYMREQEIGGLTIRGDLAIVWPNQGRLGIHYIPDAFCLDPI
jgi:putative endonuclease